MNQIKKLVEYYPREVDEDTQREIEENGVKNILKHHKYIYKLPVYIRLVDFTDQEQLNDCYDKLENQELGKDMTPEEALALLHLIAGRRVR